MTRTYVITGAASGIGAATARLLREAGHQVIGVDLHHADVNADLSTPQGRQEAVNAVKERAGGKVDAVIACAGLATPTVKTAQVNYFGVTEFMQGLRPLLEGAQAPRAVITSSMASLMPSDPELLSALLSDDEPRAVAAAQRLIDTGGGMQQLIYGSSKRAISRWVRRECVKPEWAGQGIPLNAVGPGIVKTPMTSDMISTAEARAALDKQVPMPLNSYMEAEDVARLLIWLAGPENTHVTGQTIYIDGGSDAVLRGDNVWDLARP